MASEELKSSSPPETDEHPESCVTDPDPEGHYEPEDREIVGEVDSVECKGAVANPTHPLEHSWTFWFDNPSAKSKRVAWGASIRPMYTFSTVEEFWSLYNNIHHPSKLAVGADFYCFKNKIEPKWEDPVCANGGKWTVNFNRGESDTCWLYSLLAMIGEQFYHGDEICGVVVNVRGRQEKISLWTKNASNESAMFNLEPVTMYKFWFQNLDDLLFLVPGEEEQKDSITFRPDHCPGVSIGKQWKEFLDHNETIGFIFHDDAEKFGKSAKNRYTV